MTDIHYICLTAPYNRNEATRQNGVAGPREMSAVLEENKSKKVYFWCYDSEVEYYDNFFEKQVTVLGCSTYLEKILDQARKKNDRYRMWLTVRMLDIINLSELGLSKDTLFARNIFAFFLLYFEGGYVLNTKVFPYGAPEFSNHLNYKVLNLIDKHNFQELLHIIPNRRFFSKYCIVLNTVSEESDPDLQCSWHDFDKLELIDKTYYKNYDDRDFRKMIFRGKVLDHMVQYSKIGDDIPLQALDYCLRIWPLVYKENLLRPNEKINAHRMQHFMQMCNVIVVGAVYNAILHRKSWLQKIIGIFDPHASCRHDLPEKYLFHAMYQHMKRTGKQLNQEGAYNSYLVKELNILNSYSESKEHLDNAAELHYTEYLKKLLEHNITGDLKKMDWWWQLEKV